MGLEGTVHGQCGNPAREHPVLRQHHLEKTALQPYTTVTGHEYYIFKVVVDIDRL